ncbi:MAG: radical SAM protein [Akkermansia sp.]
MLQHKKCCTLGMFAAPDHRQAYMNVHSAGVWGGERKSEMSEVVQETEEPDERSLVERLIADDESAWCHVINSTLRPYILSLQMKQGASSALRRVHPDAVLSGVYWRLARGNASALRHFRFDCRLSTFLYYWVRDAWQAEQRSAGAPVAEFPLPMLPDTAPASDNTFQGVLLREQMSETESCLQLLYTDHPLHFCVLASRIMWHKSSKDTARLMQRSVDWVDQMLHRAQKYMRAYRAQGAANRIFPKRSAGRSPLFPPTTSKIHMNQKIQWKNGHAEAKVRTCMLMITHACNLNCTYCYEAFKSRRFMSAELAKEAILKEAEVVRNDTSYLGLEIDLMGGEPMTNFPLIQELVEWAESGPITVPFLFFICSNGTLFTEERKRWFEAHRDVVIVGISYDGTPEMQSKNRMTDAYTVDQEWFHKTWPFQSMHMTISKETLPHLAAGILELQRKGYPLDAALAQGVDWNEQDATIYEEQLQMLADTYLREPELPPIRLFAHAQRILPSSDIRVRKQERWCGSGGAMITYDVDGKTYGCHMFSPIVLGDKAAELRTLANQCSDHCEDDFCRECVLKLVCPTCAGFNYRYRGDVSRRDHRWCPMILAQARVVTAFQIRALARLSDAPDAYETELADTALKAYAVLQQLSCPHAPYTSAADM